MSEPRDDEFHFYFKTASGMTDITGRIITVDFCQDCVVLQVQITGDREFSASGPTIESAVLAGVARKLGYDVSFNRTTINIDL